ncbi:hypothetical protein JKP88DRAFT_271590 [Tribonema minus]|uniref:EcxA zinc-binding domain-containing protein n=1 Tax=Tribonema minus TaxID=303371 RepID=A0A835ZFA7_9STRA|nr:hypothetical protein JKP88DRAFT_271590 [Tribonema minus]
MHEVGHTLGLRHNFRGSTGPTLAQLQSPKYTSKFGLTTSVMDYLPINIVSAKLRAAAGVGPIGPDHNYFTPVLGSYDMWAIEYGYMDVSQADAVAPATMFDQHPDLETFSTDEDRSRNDGIDPFVSVFDLSSDPLAFFADRLDVVAEIRPKLLDRAVQLGEPFTRYSDSEKMLLQLIKVSGLYAAKYIGGMQLSKQRRIATNTQAPATPVSAAQQREALALLVKILTGVEAVGSAANSTSVDFLPEPTALPLMVQTGGVCEGIERYCLATEPYDVLTDLQTVREMILLNVLSLDRLDMVRLNSWGKQGSSAFTIRELFTTLTDAIWGGGLIASTRAASPENWAIMLFWGDLLMAIAVAIPSSGGDIAAAAAGEAYRIAASAPALDPSAPAWGLSKEFQRRLSTWERGAWENVAQQR